MNQAKVRTPWDDLPPLPSLGVFFIDQAHLLELDEEQFRLPSQSEEKRKKQNQGRIEKQSDIQDLGIRKCPKPQAPEEPEPDECCGSGCVRCVFDIYYERLEQYEEELREWEEKEEVRKIKIAYE